MAIGDKENASNRMFLKGWVLIGLSVGSSMRMLFGIRTLGDCCLVCRQKTLVTSTQDEYECFGRF
jgi:hypothetical protein